MKSGLGRPLPMPRMQLRVARASTALASGSLPWRSAAIAMQLSDFHKSLRFIAFIVSIEKEDNGKDQESKETENIPPLFQCLPSISAKLVLTTHGAILCHIVSIKELTLCH